MKHLIFLCVATCIFILIVIVLNVAPSINGLVGKSHYDKWGNMVSVSLKITYYGFADYSSYTDDYNDINDGVTTFTCTQEEKEKYLDHLKDGKSDY